MDARGAVGGLAGWERGRVASDGELRALAECEPWRRAGEVRARAFCGVCDGARGSREGGLCEVQLALGVAQMWRGTACSRWLFKAYLSALRIRHRERRTRSWKRSGDSLPRRCQ